MKKRQSKGEGEIEQTGRKKAEKEREKMCKNPETQEMTHPLA